MSKRTNYKFLKKVPVRKDALRRHLLRLLRRTELENMIGEHHKPYVYEWSHGELHDYIVHRWDYLHDKIKVLLINHFDTYAK